MPDDGHGGQWCGHVGHEAPVEGKRFSMAFLRKTIRGNGSETGRGRISQGLGGVVRWVALPGIGLALATWSITGVAGVYSTSTLASAESFVPRALPLSLSDPLKQARLTKKFAPTAEQAKTDRLAAALVAPAEKPVIQVAKDPFETVVARASLSPQKLHAAFAATSQQPVAKEDPFARVVAGAGLSPEKMLAAFAKAGMEIPERPVQLASAAPADQRFYELAALPGELDVEADRFGPKTAAVEQFPHLGLALEPRVELAYASPDPTEALDDWGRFAPLLGAEDDAAGEDPASVEGMPDAVPLPPRRPKTAVAPPKKPDISQQKPEIAVAKPNRLIALLKPDAAKPKKLETAKPKTQARTSRSDDSEALAFAKPDKPRGMANSFRNLFDTPKAKAGTAIYDISAGVVHMPDGSKLEAHSGIGKMANNPKYVHVKMNGPTPPNTYKLSMRESRFYGVEAIRMTPVGEQTMHGRGGILAHSYLLRGGRPESHGCVAFKDYNRFLTAFKKGKVKQIVVVPSLSRSQVRTASTGGA